MKRRRFLSGSAVSAGAAVAAAALPGPALSQGLKTLNMVTSWPRNFPGLGQSAHLFADTLTTLSNGRFDVVVHAGGAVAHAVKCNDAVQQGAADIYHSFDHYYGGKAAAYMFFTSAPFGFTAHEMEAWIGYGGGQAIWDDIGGQFGIKHFAGGYTGAQLGGWSKKPVRQATDFKGRKIAAAGFGAGVLRALGATPRLLSGTEIKEALAKGAIDGAEWAGPWTDMAIGFHDAAKIYHYPGLYQPGSMLSIGIARKLWDRLSETDRRLFETAAARANNWTVAAFTAKNAAAVKALTTDHGVRLVEYGNETSRQLAEAAADVLAAAGGTDPLAQKAYQSFMAFRKKMAEWTDVAERPFLERRGLMKM